MPTGKTMPKKGRVTLKDIAERAGVSAGAVSFVLTNTGRERRISEATVGRVQAIAREMGYHPNIAARNLRARGKGPQVFVVSIVTSAESPIHLVSNNFARLQNTFRAEGGDRLYVTQISTFEPGRISDVPGLLDGRFFNAAVIANTTHRDDEVLAELELPYPSILIGREIPGYASFVPSWNAGLVAAEGLLEAGARRPFVLAQPPSNQIIRRRVLGFTEAMEAALGEKPVVLQAKDPSEAAGYAVVRAYLETARVPMDSLFCVHDSLAIGACLALRERNLRIPEAVKVVGVGDSGLAPYLSPKLSTAGAEDPAVYDQATALLLERIREPGSPPRTLRAQATFVRRESV
jgi:LacI family transcriptional regulator